MDVVATLKRRLVPAGYSILDDKETFCINISLLVILKHSSNPLKDFFGEERESRLDMIKSMHINLAGVIF